MKINHLETFIVATPPPHIGGMYWIFVRLETDCGIEGVGEIYSASFHPQAQLAMIEDVFERYLKGHNPHHIERFYRQAFSSGFTQRPDLSMMGILSGLEIACWDIIGKAAGQPVYELIGGRIHERIRTYTYLYPEDEQGNLDYDDPDLAVACALQDIERGYSAVKFDPAGPYTAYSGHQLSLGVMRRCETFCRKLRDAVGDRCDLLFGTHGQMTPAAAIRLAKRLAPYDLLWFEEPVPPGQPQAMAEVARHTDIPIATGERLTSKYEFHQLLQSGAVGIVQMNLGRVGGILEAKKIAAMAEAYYVQIAPHIYNGPVGAAASLQLATATPNFLIQEHLGRGDDFQAELLQQPISWQKGDLIPPTAPGLGITMNWQAVRAHSPYTGRKLHLQMQPFPFDAAADNASGDD